MCRRIFHQLDGPTRRCAPTWQRGKPFSSAESANGDFTSCFNGVLSIKKSGDLGDQISCLMIFCYQICGDIMDK